jgi:hypothetical protein
MTKRVDVAGIEDGLYRTPPNPPAAQPDERTQAMRQLPEVEQFPGREGVEIADQRMGTSE